MSKSKGNSAIEKILNSKIKFFETMSLGLNLVVSTICYDLNITNLWYRYKLKIWLIDSYLQRLEDNELMIRNGHYWIYNNIEYEINNDIDGNTLIITQDKTKIDSSFTDGYNSGVYSKKIDEKEIEEIYKIHTFGKIRNLIVNVENEVEDCYIVSTSNLEIAKKLGLERCHKYYHQGKILTKDIIVTEEKTKIK